MEPQANARALCSADFHMCERKRSLINKQRSKQVFNSLKGGTFESYLEEINQENSCQTIFDRLRARYNMSHRKLSLKSEFESQNFDDLIAHSQIQNEKECL